MIDITINALLEQMMRLQVAQRIQRAPHLFLIMQLIDADGRCFHARLEYEQGEVRFMSSVYIFAGDRRHFILTFLSRLADYEQQAPLETMLVETFRAPDLQRRKAELRPGAIGFWKTMIALAIILAVAGAYFVKVKLYERGA